MKRIKLLHVHHIQIQPSKGILLAFSEFAMIMQIDALSSLMESVSSPLTSLNIC